MIVKADITGNHLAATTNFDVRSVKRGLNDPNTLVLRVNNAVGGN